MLTPQGVERRCGGLQSNVYQDLHPTPDWNFCQFPCRSIHAQLYAELCFETSGFDMVRLLLALLLFVSLPRAWPQAPSQEEVRDQQPSEENLNEWSELPDAPSALRRESPSSASETTKFFFETLNPGEGFQAAWGNVAEAFSPATFETQSRAGRPGTEMVEP